MFTLPLDLIRGQNSQPLNEYACCTKSSLKTLKNADVCGSILGHGHLPCHTFLLISRHSGKVSALNRLGMNSEGRQ